MRKSKRKKDRIRGVGARESCVRSITVPNSFPRSFHYSNLKVD